MSNTASDRQNGRAGRQKQSWWPPFPFNVVISKERVLKEGKKFPTLCHKESETSHFYSGGGPGTQKLLSKPLTSTPIPQTARRADRMPPDELMLCFYCLLSPSDLFVPRGSVLLGPVRFSSFTMSPEPVCRSRLFGSQPFRAPRWKAPGQAWLPGSQLLSRRLREDRFSSPRSHTPRGL